MADIGQLVDLEIPVMKEYKFPMLRLFGRQRYQTELLISALQDFGFSISEDYHNIYHGLSSIGTLRAIFNSGAIMGPSLVEESNQSVARGESYAFPEQKFILGNTPDYGEYVGFANLEHASRVATCGAPLDVSFGEYTPIILRFKAFAPYPVVSVNYIKVDHPEDGLGLIIAPASLKGDVEALLAQSTQYLDFTRIYVSFAKRPN